MLVRIYVGEPVVRKVAPGGERVGQRDPSRIGIAAGIAGSTRNTAPDRDRGRSLRGPRAIRSAARPGAASERLAPWGALTAGDC